MSGEKSNDALTFSFRLLQTSHAVAFLPASPDPGRFLSRPLSLGWGSSAEALLSAGVKRQIRAGDP